MTAEAMVNSSTQGTAETAESEPGASSGYWSCPGYSSPGYKNVPLFVPFFPFRDSLHSLDQ